MFSRLSFCKKRVERVVGLPYWLIRRHLTIRSGTELENKRTLQPQTCSYSSYVTQKIKSQESTYQNPESIGNSEVLDINKMKFFMIKIELLHSVQKRWKIQKLGGGTKVFYFWSLAWKIWDNAKRTRPKKYPSTNFAGPILEWLKI